MKRFATSLFDKDRRGARKLGLALTSSAAAGALAASLMGGIVQPGFSQSVAETAPKTEAPDVALSQGRMPQSFADLAERLSPAVVNITTSTHVSGVAQGPQGIVPEGSPFEEFFRDFMDRQPGAPDGPGMPNMPRQRQSSALGSGFIISTDGFIVTNNHVIEQADEIEIETFSGETLKAELIGSDPRTDIALLKVESDEPLPFVSFGNSDQARVGDWVLAIGNPLGQGFSVSSGIVSARNRTLQGSYDDFIQTDAAINRGNSGGPLFDLDGNVIGVNTAILSPNGGSIGIGFAMSSAVVERVVDQLRDYGETRRGWLGVRIQNVDKDVAEALGLDQPSGALVTDVPEGPALIAGLQAGDVILSFNGEEIEDSRELVKVVADTPVGEDVEVTVFRDGNEESLQVEVGRLEEAVLAAAPGPEGDNGAPAGEQTVLGLTVSSISEALREEYGLEDDATGLLVTGVEEGSDAEEKGLAPGDVIVEVGQEMLSAPRELRDRIKAAEEAGRNSILLLVRRDDAPRFVALTLSN